MVQAFYEHLQYRSYVEIAKVVVKSKNKQRTIPDHLILYNANDIVEDEEIQVVVELIDDAHTSFDIAQAALIRSKILTNANKKCLLLI